MSRNKTVKDSMADAYIRLLSKKHYTDITVSDVVSEAKVARASFYRNFSTTYDILEMVLKNFEQNVIKKILPIFMVDRDRAWRELTTSVVHEIKYGEMLNYKPLPENSDYILNCIQKTFNLKSMVDSIDLKSKYTPVVNISILFGCLNIWVKSDFKESEEAIIDFICETIKRNTVK